MPGGINLQKLITEKISQKKHNGSRVTPAAQHARGVEGKIVTRVQQALIILWQKGEQRFERKTFIWVSRNIRNVLGNQIMLDTLVRRSSDVGLSVFITSRELHSD